MIVRRLLPALAAVVVLATTAFADPAPDAAADPLAGIAAALEAGDAAAARTAIEASALDAVALAPAWQELAYIYYRAEDFAAARDCLATARDGFAASAAPDADALAWVGADLAEMHRLLGDFDAAERELLAAVETSRRKREPDAIHAVLLNNLAGLTWDQGRLDETERLLREALPAREAAGDTLALATALLNLGSVRRAQHVGGEAHELHERALRLARGQVPADDPELLWFLKEAALSASSVGARTEALARRQEALALVDAQDGGFGPDRVELWHEVARDLAAGGDADEARTAFRRARDTAESVFGTAHARTGAIAADLAIFEGRRLGFDDPRVREIVAAALAALEGTRSEPMALARARVARASEFRAGDRPDEARTQLRNALSLIDDLRAHRGSDRARIEFLADHANWSDELIAWCVQDGRVDEALAQVERVRARVLRERIAGGQIDLRAGLPPELADDLERRLRTARRTISQTRLQLEGLRAAGGKADATAVSAQEAALRDALTDYEAAENDLKLHSPAWQEVLRAESPAIALADLRDRLHRRGEMILAYRIGAERSWAFVVSGDAPPTAWALTTAGEPLTRDRLAHLVRAVHGPTVVAAAGTNERGVVATKPFGAAPAAPAGPPSPVASEALARAILPPPVRAELERHAAVVVLPDSHLHQVAFDGLVWTAAGGDVRYWLDDGPIVSVAPSLSAAARSPASSPAHRDRGGRLLSVANPAFGSAALAPLPGAERESAAIRATFAPDRVVALVGAEATETRVRELAPGCRYLHFATHGLARETEDESLAALAFAANPAGTDDGFLHLFEIYELELDAELAVLSACDTNVGPVVEGEGVFALSRGFHGAGVARVVATLRPVHDDATAELMRTFFAAVTAAESNSEPPDYARLLRDAKRALRKGDEWSSPHYWAPFVLSQAH